MAKKNTQFGQSPIDYNNDFATEHTLILDNGPNGDVGLQQRVNIVAFQPEMDRRMEERGVDAGNFVAYANLDPERRDEYQRKYELLLEAEELRTEASKVKGMASGKHAFDDSHRAAVEKLITHFNEADIESRYASIRQVNQAIRAYNDHFPELPHIPLVLNEEQQKTADEFLSRIQNINFKAPASEQVLRDAIESYQALSQDKDNLAIQQYVFPQLQQAYDTYTSISTLSAESKESIQIAFESLDTNFPDSKEMNREALRQLGEVAGAQVIQDQIDKYAPATITPEQLQQLVVEYSQADPEVKQKLYNDMATLTYHAIEAQSGVQWGSVQTDLYEAYERSFESSPQRVRDFVEECHNMSIDYDNAQERLDAIAKTYGAMTPAEQASVYGSISEVIDKIEEKEPIKTVTTVTAEDKKVDLSKIPGIAEFTALSSEKQKEYIDMAIEHFKPHGTVKEQLNEQLAYLRDNHPETYAEIEGKIIGNNFRAFRDGEFVSNSPQAASAYFEQVKAIAEQHGVDLGGEYYELQRIKAEAEKNNGTYDISSLSTIRDYILNEYQQVAQLEREIAIEEARKQHDAHLQQQMDDGKVLLSVMAVAHNMESSTAKSIPTGLDYIDSKWESLTPAQQSFVAQRYLNQLELTHASATHENSGVYLTGFQKNGDVSETIDLKIDKVIDEHHFICLNQKNEQVLVMTEHPIPAHEFSANDVRSVLDGKPVQMPASFDSAVQFSISDGKLMADVPQPTSGKFNTKYEPNMDDVRSYEVLSLRQDGERSVMLLRDVETDSLVKVSSARSRSEIEQSAGVAVSFSNDGQSISLSQKHSVESSIVNNAIIYQDLHTAIAFVKNREDLTLKTDENSIEVTAAAFSRNNSNQLVITNNGQEFVIDKLNSTKENLAISTVSANGEKATFFINGSQQIHYDELFKVLNVGIKEVNVQDKIARIEWDPVNGSDVRTSSNKNELTITYRDGREDVTGYISAITYEPNGMTKITAMDLETGQQTILHTQVPYQDALNAYGQALQTSLEQKPISMELMSLSENAGQVVANVEGKEYQLLSITHTTENCQIIATYNDHVVKFNLPSEDYSKIVEQIQATGLSSVQYAEQLAEKEPLTTKYVSDKAVFLEAMGTEIDSRGDNLRVSSISADGRIEKADIQFLHLTHNHESETIDIQLSAVNGNERTAYNIQGLSYSEFRTFIENSNLHRDAPENVQVAFAEQGSSRERQQENIQTICSYLNSQQDYLTMSVHTHVQPGDLIRVSLDEKNLGTKAEPDMHTVLHGTAYDNSQITIVDPQFIRGNDGGLYVFGEGKDSGECFRVYSTQFGKFQEIQHEMQSQFSWEHLGVKNYVENVEFVHTAEPRLQFSDIDREYLDTNKMASLFEERSAMLVTTAEGEVEKINVNAGTFVSKEYGFIAAFDADNNKINITYFEPDAIDSKLKLEPSRLSIDEIPRSEEAAREAGFACVDYEHGVAIKNDGEVFKMSEKDVRLIFDDQTPPSFSSPGITMQADKAYLTAADLPEYPRDQEGILMTKDAATSKGFVMIDWDNGIAIKNDGRCYTISQEEIDKAYPEGRPYINFVDMDKLHNVREMQSDSRFVAPEVFNGAKEADVNPTINQWSISGYPPKLFYNESSFGSDTHLLTPTNAINGMEIQSMAIYSEKGKPAEIVVTVKQQIENDGNSTSHVSQVRLGMPTEEQLTTMERFTERTAGDAATRLEHYVNQVNAACADKTVTNDFSQQNHLTVEPGRYCIVHNAGSDVGRLYEIVDKQGTMVAVGTPSNSEAYQLIYRNGQAEGYNVTLIEPASDIHKYADHLAQQGKGVYAEIRDNGEAVRIGNLDLARDDDGTRHVNGMTVSARFDDCHEAVDAQRAKDEHDLDNNGPDINE